MTDLWPKLLISRSVVLELTGGGWILGGGQAPSLFLNFKEAEAMARVILNLSRSGPGEPSAQPQRLDTGGPAHQTLAQKVAEQIRQAIVAGLHPPGMRLEENALARTLGVSRTPVREALGQLASAGLVTYEPRKGCRVAVRDP